jgi:hypothetical protein
MKNTNNDCIVYCPEKIFATSLTIIEVHCQEFFNLGKYETLKSSPTSPIVNSLSRKLYHTHCNIHIVSRRRENSDTSKNQPANHSLCQLMRKKSMDLTFNE